MPDVTINTGGNSFTLHFEGDVPPPDVLDKIVAQEAARQGIKPNAPPSDAPGYHFRPPAGATPSPAAPAPAAPTWTPPTLAPVTPSPSSAPDPNAPLAGSAADPNRIWRLEQRAFGGDPSKDGALAAAGRKAALQQLAAIPGYLDARRAGYAAQDAPPPTGYYAKFGGGAPTPKAQAAKVNAAQVLAKIPQPDVLEEGSGDTSLDRYYPLTSEVPALAARQVGRRDNGAGSRIFDDTGHLIGAQDWRNWAFGLATAPLTAMIPGGAGFGAAKFAEGALTPFVESSVVPTVEGISADMAGTLAGRSALGVARDFGVLPQYMAAKTVQYGAPAIAGGAGAALANATQNALIGAYSPSSLAALNAANEAVHAKTPILSYLLQAAGGVAPWQRPGELTLGSIPGRLAGGGINAGMTAAQNAMTGQPTTYSDVLGSLLAGGMYSDETLAGHQLGGEASSVGRRVASLGKVAAGVAGRQALEKGAQTALQRAGQVVGGDGATAEPPVAAEPVHHSALQPRDEAGHFAGPPVQPAQPVEAAAHPTPEMPAAAPESPATGLEGAHGVSTSVEQPSPYDMEAQAAQHAPESPSAMVGVRVPGQPETFTRVTGDALTAYQSLQDRFDQAMSGANKYARPQIVKQYQSALTDLFGVGGVKGATVNEYDHGLDRATHEISAVGSKPAPITADTQPSATLQAAPTLPAEVQSGHGQEQQVSVSPTDATNTLEPAGSAHPGATAAHNPSLVDADRGNTPAIPNEAAGKPLKQPAEFVGSTNLDRIGVDEPAKQVIRDVAAAHGLDTKTTVTHNETVTAARALGVTANELRQVPLGGRREGVTNTDAWNHAVREVVAYHADQGARLQEQYNAAAPNSPERADLLRQMTQNNLDAAVALAHDSRNAAEVGRGLNARKIQSQPVRGALAGTTTDSLLYPTPRETASASKMGSTQRLTADLTPPSTTPAAPAGEPTLGKPPKGGAGKGAGRSRRIPTEGAEAKPKASIFAKNKLITEDQIKQSLAAFGKISAGGGVPIDPALLPHAVRIGAGLIEAGYRHFSDFSAAMRGHLGEWWDERTEGQKQYIYAGSRSELTGHAKQAGAAKPAAEVLADELARPAALGSRQAASDFINALNERAGGASGTDLFDKLIAAGSVDHLTPAEQAIIGEEMERQKAETAAARQKAAASKPAKTTSDAMKTILAIRENAQAQAKAEKAAAATEAANAAAAAAAQKPAPAVKPAPSLIDQYIATQRARFGSAENAAAFRATVGDAILGKMVAGKPLSPPEKTALSHALDAHTPASAPKPRSRFADAAKTMQEGAKAWRAGLDKEPPAPKTDTDRFMESAARMLGSRERADQWRAAIGEDILGKHVRGEALTDAETQRSGRALLAAQRPRVTGPQAAENVKTLGKMLRETKRQVERERIKSLSPKQLVQEALLSAVPTDDKGNPTDPAFVSRLTTDLAGIGDHDTRRLNNVLSNYSTDLAENYKAYLRSGALSGTSTLGKIGLSHVLAAVSRMAERPATATGDRLIAAITGSGRRTTAGPSAAPEAAAFKSMGAALPESRDILTRGENAVTLEGRNKFAETDSRGLPKLRPEFSLPNKFGGAVINPVVRAFLRVHGALYHVANEGHYARGLSEWAQVHAMNEATAQGLRGAARDSHVKARTAELLATDPNDLPAEAHEYALQHKDVQMFTNPNKASAKINALVGEDKQNPTAGSKAASALAANVAMFTKVPANIVGKGIEYTGGPLTSGYALARALQSRLIGEYVRGENGSAPRLVKFGDLPEAEQQRLQHIWAETFGRGAAGTGMVAAGYALQKAGILNAPNEEKHERGSVNAFGRKYVISGIQPVATPFLAGATIADQGLNPHAAKEVAMNTLEENPLIRAAESIDALKSTSSDAKEQRDATRAAGGVLAQHVPLSVLTSEIAASTDPTGNLRRKTGVLDYALNRIPGARETLTPSADINGRPIPETGGLFHALPNSPIPAPNAVDMLRSVIDAHKQIITDYWANPHPTAADFVRYQAAQKWLTAQARDPRSPFHAMLSGGAMRHYLQGQQGK